MVQTMHLRGKEQEEFLKFWEKHKNCDPLDFKNIETRSDYLPPVHWMDSYKEEACDE
jgi:hypothetical protein